MIGDNKAQLNEVAKPFRVLSLDGGGSKGVYTLGVLKEVEAAANAPLCEVFDLIFGTSTGSIITALIALGYRIEEIENLYFTLIPKIMRHRFSRERTKALKAEADKLFVDQDFSAFKTLVGIVCTNYDFERPMVFKNSVQQSHGRAATFKPGFGCTIAEAVVASCAAYPFFEKVKVKTENQGEPLLMDGGYVANNPTLFALADTYHALNKDTSEIAVLSVGVGSYNEPKRSIFHQIIFRFWPFRHIAKMFNISSGTIDQLRIVLFPQVPCVRVSESYPQPEYATDLLEDDVQKLRKLHSLGRESFAKYEREIRATLKI
ncbi:patatin [Ktedonobacter sp. SOSP1-85]|uniref:patatin-like phospholipase family protein n=1 Tax=Ktedonobacter sp. SOSP1-85 TaxID=2778367 RepID=UPI0019151D8B|nr:patatin-like phospholipase family protein [Ktedonobacter sp. SOSP1-85]GHO73941.1 patatin [Ktedonobacter sp. SOSP1-85]